MPKQKKRLPPSAFALGGGMDIEIKKSRLGAVALVTGVLSISELSDEAVAVLSHLGRVFIRGERLTVTALENRTLAIYGKITGVEMTYGRI